MTITRIPCSTSGRIPRQTFRVAMLGIRTTYFVSAGIVWDLADPVCRPVVVRDRARVPGIEAGRRTGLKRKLGGAFTEGTLVRRAGVKRSPMPHKGAGKICRNSRRRRPRTRNSIGESSRIATARLREAKSRSGNGLTSKRSMLHEWPSHRGTRGRAARTCRSPVLPCPRACKSDTPAIAHAPRPS